VSRKGRDFRGDRGRDRGRGRPQPPSQDTIEGRNPVFEALQASTRVRKILLDERSKPDPKLERILALASERRVEIHRVPRPEIDELAEGGVHNGIIALADPLRPPTMAAAIDASLDRDDPLFLLLDEVQYEQNLGAILRTADAAGACAIVIPKRRGARLSAVSQRIAMGAAEHVPVIHCAILEALSLLKRTGFRVVGADEHAHEFHHQVDLTGPLAIVMGGEDKGITPTVRKKCDALVRIPMVGHVPSLNVSVSTGVLLFERLRQLGEGGEGIR
jgi:23S rRNA (guanosine2251-2'-O)-methyltransferase